MTVPGWCAWPVTPIPPKLVVLKPLRPDPSELLVMPVTPTASVVNPQYAISIGSVGDTKNAVHIVEVAEFCPKIADLDAYFICRNTVGYRQAAKQGWLSAWRSQ
jgi:hypothetical protein